MALLNDTKCERRNRRINLRHHFWVNDVYNMYLYKVWNIIYLFSIWIHISSVCLWFWWYQIWYFSLLFLFLLSCDPCDKVYFHAINYRLVFGSLVQPVTSLSIVILSDILIHILSTFVNKTMDKYYKSWTALTYCQI